MSHLLERCKPSFHTKTALLTLFILFCVIHGIHAADRHTSPISNKGKKWRIGYYEGGSYINYPANLKALANGLTQLGWMAKENPVPIASSEDSKEIWTHLANSSSPYLDFMEIVFWSAKWDRVIRAKQRVRTIKALQQKQVDAINLTTADSIGFDPPKGLMKVVDEIYR